MEEFQKDDLDPHHPNSVITIFHAGNSASIEQAASYIGPRAKVCGASRASASTLLYNVFDIPPYCDPYDITRDPTDLPFYLRWTKHLEKVKLAFQTIDTPEAPSWDITKMNLAQERDIENHRRMLVAATKHESYDENRPIILFGCSRGAATTLVSVLRLWHNEPELLSRVKGVILEAPFASVEDTVESRYTAYLAPLALTILNTFTSFKAGSFPSPLEHCAKYPWPKHIPVAIVRSQIDTEVPPSGTKAIIDAMRANPQNSEINLHEIVLSYSSHSAMATQNRDDIRVYKTSLTKFYRECLFNEYPELFSS